MSTQNIVIGIVLGVICASLIVLWRRQYRDVFAAFLVIGILALAIAVTASHVDQYWAHRAAAPQVAQTQPAPPMSGSSNPATGGIGPSMSWTYRPPMIGAPTGAAAPQPTRNPAAGNP